MVQIDGGKRTVFCALDEQNELLDVLQKADAYEWTRAAVQV
jgi:hypothetical protein